MRTGRLQSSTLASILRTLDSATNQDSPLASQKQYLPTQFDSPLYRLVTVLQVTEDFRDHDTFAVFEYYMQSRRTRDLAVEIQQTSWRRHPQRGPRTLSVPHIFQPELDPRPSPTRATQSAFDLHLRPGQHAHPRHNLHQGGSQESIFSTGSFGSISQDGQKLCIDVGDQGNVGCSNASSSRDNSPDTKEERVDSSYSTAVLPAPPEVQHLMVTTPALAASSRRRSFESESARRRSLETKATGANSPPKQKRNLDWVRDYAHIDVDWSMQAMDVLYSASFYEYIRDEKNLDLSSIRLARIIKDYKPKQVATALKWMIQGWTVENTAKLMRALFADWLPDLAGCVFYLVSKSWPKRPQLSLCCAYILLSEPAQSVALFLRTLTVTWEKEDTIELISYLDNLLEVLKY